MESKEAIFIPLRHIHLPFAVADNIKAMLERSRFQARDSGYP